MFFRRKKKDRSGIHNAPEVTIKHWPDSTYKPEPEEHKIWITESDIAAVVGYKSWGQWKYLKKHPYDLGLRPMGDQMMVYAEPSPRIFPAVAGVEPNHGHDGVGGSGVYNQEDDPDYYHYSGDDDD